MSAPRPPRPGLQERRERTRRAWQRHPVLSAVQTAFALGLVSIARLTGRWTSGHVSLLYVALLVGFLVCFVLRVRRTP